MKKLVCIALSALALAGAVSCNKYDDSELRSQISGLDKRVTALEGLNSTVSGLQTAVSNLQKNVSVTSVTTSGGVTTIVFSDGSKAEITNGKDGEDGTTPVIAVKEVDGVYVWTINGEVVKDANGNPIPVADLNAPQFRVSGEALEYSVDGGKTWQAVAAADPTAGITVSETDTNVTITFADGSSIVLAKDVPFTLKFSVEGPVALAAGQSADFPYEVIGATGAVDVDVLSVSEGLSASVEAKTATTGVVTVTNVKAKEGTSKVFVYAADHNGKSDIVSLHFTVGGGEEPGPGPEPEPEVVFEAALDAELIPAEGGEFVLNVSADEDYTVSVSAGAKEWLSVSAPTRALYEDDLVVTVAKNETTGQRSATITLSSKVSDKVIAVDVLQEAGEEPAPEGYASFLGAWNNGSKTMDIYEYENEDGELVENIYDFTYSDFYEGEIAVPAIYSKENDALCFVTVTLEQDGNWIYFFAALDSDDYIETGGAEGDEILAYALKNEAGDGFTIYGNEYDAVYSGTTYHEKIVSLSIFAYLSADEGNYQKGYYLLNGVTEMKLPCTFTKAAAQSAIAAHKRAVLSHESLTPVMVRNSSFVPASR